MLTRSPAEAGAESANNRRTAGARRSDVKKLLVVAVAAAAGFAIWRKLEADKAEQALWAEVTDPVR
jgi:hypothetical protein